MRESKRTWHLLSNRWNSAITEYALSAARALQLKGHETVFTALAGSPAEERARQHFKVVPLPRFTILEVGKVLAHAAEYRPDVVLAYGGPELFLSGFVKRATGARIFRFRGQALEQDGRLAALKHRMAHATVDGIITPSFRMAETIARFGSPSPPFAVPLGIDTERFQRRRVEAQSRPELVIFGRLDPIKGHQVAFRTMTKVLKAWPSASPRPRLHVVGETANLSVTHLERGATEAGLAVGDDVIFTVRRVTNVAELMSQAALGWIPSIGSEIICRVAEEFLACGTPIAVSGVGSLDETLFEGAGFSYAGLSEDETAQRLSDWIRQSTAEGEAVKARRAETAQRTYSLEAMGAALQKLF